jgi:HD-GYP domain-containing protein (c-di-GMP phosphodiesterase class II)
MIVNPQVPLHRLVLSLSEALDFVHPQVVDHQQRVAYIATNMGRQMGLRGMALLDLLNAAALHDIGLVGVEHRIRTLHLGRLEDIAWHCTAGYELLRDNPLFAEAADVVRHHHIVWADGRGAESDGQPVPLGSHIIALADKVERAINRELPVLQQAEGITAQVTDGVGRIFRPECVEAFRQASRPEAFWLDAVNERVYSVLLKQMDWPAITLDEGAVGPIAEIFARIVDAASRWTALHSAGVTATAVALAERLSFSPRELNLLRAAGYLHDLGKLSVPTSILDKAGPMTPGEWAVMNGHPYHTFRILDTIGGLPQISEWAAFHHERLDGKGYPFRHAADSLTLGSRILAVADIFAATTEDRPYRPGMTLDESTQILERRVADGGLDGDVVAMLKRHRETLGEIRRKEQVEYAAKQAKLAWFASQPEAALVS